MPGALEIAIKWCRGILTLPAVPMEVATLPLEKDILLSVRLQVASQNWWHVASHIVLLAQQQHSRGGCGCSYEGTVSS